MIQLSKPNWLKERLGSVKEYFGEQSNIEIDRIEYNRVFLNINQYIFPASFDLSNLIINRKICKTNKFIKTKRRKRHNSITSFNSNQ
jgi:hypothetical protein